MPAYRKACIRELASAAYELNSDIVEGRLYRSTEDGHWMVDDSQLNERLNKYNGQEVVLIVAPLNDDRPVPKKTCRTCGTEYVGTACPRCREVRIRLRGF